MSKIPVQCPHCSARGSIDEQYAGRQISCPSCRHVFILSAQAPEAQVQPAGTISEQRYLEAQKLVTEAEQLWQCNDSDYEVNLHQSLVKLSPESIKAIVDHGWGDTGFSEDTNAFYVGVLTRIAKERSLQEREQVARILSAVLHVPDDGTQLWYQLRGSCINALDELNALPGTEGQKTPEPGVSEEFQLPPIEKSEIGEPQQTDPYPNPPGLEAEALWQLILRNDYEEVINRFECNYGQWQKAWPPRDLDLAFHSYGMALERQKRYADAVLAYRWSCKLNPYRLNDSWNRVEMAEKEAARQKKE